VCCLCVCSRARRHASAGARAGVRHARPLHAHGGATCRRAARPARCQQTRGSAAAAWPPLVPAVTRESWPRQRRAQRQLQRTCTRARGTKCCGHARAYVRVRTARVLRARTASPSAAPSMWRTSAHSSRLRSAASTSASVAAAQRGSKADENEASVHEWTCRAKARDAGCRAAPRRCRSACGTRRPASSPSAASKSRGGCASSAAPGGDTGTHANTHHRGLRVAFPPETTRFCAAGRAQPRRVTHRQARRAVAARTAWRCALCSTPRCSMAPDTRDTCTWPQPGTRRSLAAARPSACTAKPGCRLLGGGAAMARAQQRPLCRPPHFCRVQAKHPRMAHHHLSAAA
jgi:hypothetical protein